MSFPDINQAAKICKYPAPRLYELCQSGFATELPAHFIYPDKSARVPNADDDMRWPSSVAKNQR